MAANARMRLKLTEMTGEEEAELFVPPIALCTDNAAMSAGIAFSKLAAGQVSGLDVDVSAGLVRRGRASSELMGSRPGTLQAGRRGLAGGAASFRRAASQ